MPAIIVEGRGCIIREALFWNSIGAKGKYFVTVYVCRGEAYASDGLTVNVR
jgi:hypothetical protein